MTDEQLKEGQILKRILSTTEQTIKKVETLKLSWGQNETRYNFYKDQLGDDPVLIEMFKTATETCKAILHSQLENYAKKLEKEFKKL